MAAKNASSASHLQNSPQDWIIHLCHEPDGDAKTCCLGFFFPYVLYGRSQYRLKQKAQGKDALDLADYIPFNNECGAFLAIHYLLYCGWGCTFAQHLQVKKVYGIPSNLAVDCLQALYCWPCTLMQDEREICAREKLFKDQKEQATINYQPAREPKMEYAVASFIESPETQSPSYSASLTRVGELTPVAAQPQGLLNNHDIRNENASKFVNDYEHTCELSQGNYKAATGTGNSHISKRKQGAYNLIPSISTKSIKKSSRPNMEEKDAIIASRQPWRSQRAARQAASSETDIVRIHSQHHQGNLAQRQGDSVARSENRNPTAMFSSSERSVSEPLRLSKRKSVQRSFSSVDSFGRDLANSADSGNKLRRRTMTETSDAVLVYYSDGERPQRHRVADCTRIRDSTPSRPDAPPYEHHLSDCPSEPAASGTGISETSKMKLVTGRAEMTSVDILKNLAPEHTLDNSIGNPEDNSKAVQHPYMSSKLINCPDGWGSHSDLVLKKDKNENLKISQHLLAECCKVDAITGVTESKNQKQHNLADCVHTEPGTESAELNSPEQHGLDSHIFMDGAESSDVAGSEYAVGSATTHGSDSEHIVQAQACNKTVTMTAEAAQPPVIIVTSIETTKPATSDKATSCEVQSSEALVTTTDPKTTEEHEIAAANSARGKDQPSVFVVEHDGVNERKVMPQSSQLAINLHKVLAGDGNEEFVIEDPAKVILSDDPAQLGLGAGGTKKHRRRGRSRAGRGRGKGSKDIS